MIQLANVTKSYAGPSGAKRYILKDVSLEIPAGVNVGVLGRNGAGKTTLMRLIGGIDYPDSGTIKTNQRISPPFGLRGGFVGTLTGRDNAKFVCRVLGEQSAGLRGRVAYIEAFADLKEYFDMPMRTYSSGMKARLAFAVSMAFDYDYYLIDELLSVGDRQFRKKAREAFAEKRGKASTILVSHNTRLLSVECDAGIYIDDGRLTYFHSIRDAIRAYEYSVGEEGAATVDMSDDRDE